MNGRIIKRTEYYTLCSTEGGFVAELNSAVLSGVQGLTNIELRDSNELLLMLRVTKVVNETINPRDPVTRRIVTNQRRMYQQNIF